MWNSCPIRFYVYFILVSRRLLLTNYRVQLHSPNNHNSKAATSIARWFFANEKNYLTSQLKKHKGNISKTAEFIGMERSALHRKLKTLGIKVVN